MKIPVGSVLRNKYVLYLVLCVAIVEIITLLQLQDFDSLGLFVIVGVLATYFTKNMAIILGTALTVTNCKVCSNFIRRSMIIEGMKDKKKKMYSGEYKSHHRKNEKGKWGECEMVEEDFNDTVCDDPDVKCYKNDKCKKENFSQRSVPSSQPADVNDDGDDDDSSPGKRVDYAATVEQAYDNLQNMVGDKGMKGLTDETKRLAGQQKDLMNSLSGMAPMLESAKKTLETLDMPDLGKLQGMMKQLNGMQGK